MQIVTADFVKDKKVLLRYDIDVPIIDGKVVEDFRLKAGLLTLKLCLDHSQSVVIMGHIGRPDGKAVEELKVAPIVEWFKNNNLNSHIGSGKLVVLENLRFDPREKAGDQEYAKELAKMGDVYVNEAFSSYRPAVSTTVLPALLPHAAGLRFAQEVEKLTQVRENPQKPFIVIMGGVKAEDKLPVIKVLAQKADAVLVGGKLVAEIREHEGDPSLIAQDDNLSNVLVGKLNDDGFDIAPETVESWRRLIMGAAMIVWNGPLGKFEDPKMKQSARIAQIVLESGAEIVVGGGDTVTLLGSLGLLGEYESKGFVSVGGGAMLKFLSDGTLPTIEALA